MWHTKIYYHINDNRRDSFLVKPTDAYFGEVNIQQFLRYVGSRHFELFLGISTVDDVVISSSNVILNESNFTLYVRRMSKSSSLSVILSVPDISRDEYLRRLLNQLGSTCMLRIFISNVLMKLYEFYRFSHKNDGKSNQSQLRFWSGQMLLYLGHLFASDHV
jgi:hypothetical protein